MELSKKILAAIGNRYNRQGDSFRFRHSKKMDGTVCTSPDKDPAMTITRVADGWIYNCHRCHTSGFIGDNSRSPDSTKERIAAMKRKPVNTKEAAKLEMPYDCIPMTTYNANEPVPWEAYQWLMRYNIHSQLMLKYGISWSSRYDRVIIPLYDYIELGSGGYAKKLTGWIGREVFYVSKAERQKAKVAKYITRSNKDKRRYFYAIGAPDKVILVEDILSAILVREATGYTAIALLTTTVDENLIRRLRGKDVWLWLDADMLTYSVKTIKRMCQLGLNAKHVYTPKDPKEYNKMFIEGQINMGGVHAVPKD